MSSHVTDELPRLLTGDATYDEVVTAAGHLRVCPDCQQELVSAVVAHASLTSAHRFAPEIVAHGTPAPTALDAPLADVTALPDLSPVFAKAREEASTTAAVPARRHRRLLAVAAAVVVLAGGGVTAAEVLGGSNGSDARTVALESFPTAGPASAKITIDGSKLKVDATALPKLTSSYVYEVWLTDDARKNMAAVGTIDNKTNTAELTVASNAMSNYNDFEVSVQRSTDLKHYSGKSVVRGQYG